MGKLLNMQQNSFVTNEVPAKLPTYIVKLLITCMDLMHRLMAIKERQGYSYAA